MTYFILVSNGSTCTIMPVAFPGYDNPLRCYAYYIRVKLSSNSYLLLYLGVGKVLCGVFTSSQLLSKSHFRV